VCRGREQVVYDLTLPPVEFAYTNAVNKSTGKSPFEVVRGYSPRTPADLIPLPPDARVSQPASTFAHSIFMTCMLKFAQNFLE